MKRCQKLSGELHSEKLSKIRRTIEFLLMHFKTSVCVSRRVVVSVTNGSALKNDSMQERKKAIHAEQQIFRSLRRQPMVTKKSSAGRKREKKMIRHAAMTG